MNRKMEDRLSESLMYAADQVVVSGDAYDKVQARATRRWWQRRPSKSVLAAALAAVVFVAVLVPVGINWGADESAVEFSEAPELLPGPDPTVPGTDGPGVDPGATAQPDPDETHHDPGEHDDTTPVAPDDPVEHEPDVSLTEEPQAPDDPPVDASQEPGWNQVLDVEASDYGPLNMTDLVWTGTEFVAAGLAVTEPESVGGLWRSDDGIAWECVYCDTSEGVRQYSALEPIGDGGYVAAGHVAGESGPENRVWVSLDGTSIDYTAPLPTTAVVEDLMWHGTSEDGVLYLAAQDRTNGPTQAELWRSSSPGNVESWELVDLPDSEGQTVTELMSSEDRLFTVAPGAGLYVSEDAGVSWQFVSAEDAGLGDLMGFSSLIAHDGGYLMVGAVGTPDESGELVTDGGAVLLESTDGRSWEQAADITPRTELGNPYVVEALFVADGGTLFAVGSTEGTPAEREPAAWSSTDGGETWEPEMIAFESTDPDVEHEFDPERFSAVAQADDGTIVTVGSLRAALPGIWNRTHAIDVQDGSPAS